MGVHHNRRKDRVCIGNRVGQIRVIERIGDVKGGTWSQIQVTDRSSHLKSDEEPHGTNIGFLGGHVEWRHFRDMENRYGNPTFWW